MIYRFNNRLEVFHWLNSAIFKMVAVYINRFFEKSEYEIKNSFVFRRKIDFGYLISP